jgi:hypothetical protein
MEENAKEMKERIYKGFDVLSKTDLISEVVDVSQFYPDDVPLETVVNVFMTEVEKIPVEHEEEIPDEVATLYNELRAIATGEPQKGKKSKKGKKVKEPKQPKEKKVKEPKAPKAPKEPKVNKERAKTVLGHFTSSAHGRCDELLIAGTTLDDAVSKIVGEFESRTEKSAKGLFLDVVKAHKANGVNIEEADGVYKAIV